MRDTMFGLYNKCPQCGKTSGLYYSIQYPLELTKRLDGKLFVKNKGKRTTNIQQRIKAYIFDKSQVEFQVAYCICDLCGWCSEPITP